MGWGRPAHVGGERLGRRGRAAPAGRLLLVDADLEGDLTKLAAADGDLAIAVFADRQGGGFGLAKQAGRALVRALSGFTPREPLSGQRLLSQAAREACFPLAAGFGCEVRMTVDAARAGLRVSELELPLRHRATGRLYRGRGTAATGGDRTSAAGICRQSHACCSRGPDCHRRG